MRKERAKISLIIFLLFSLVSVTYQTQANESSSSKQSNLNNFTYPNHFCGKKPNKPTSPARLKYFADVAAYNMAIAEYNIKVSTYNKKIKAYKLCINQYIKNGNHDINFIRQHLNAALKEARLNSQPKAAIKVIIKNINHKF